MTEPSELVDTDTYPIDELSSAKRSALIERCRADLDVNAICTLQDFVRPAFIARMAAEAEGLSKKAYKNKRLRTPYGWMYNKDFEEGHPRSALFPYSNSVVLTHQFPGNTLIEELYRWDPLTEFVREALGFETLFPCACPHLSLMLSCMWEGENFGWHFDTNDGVVSLLLQSADNGGDFECAPYIRSEDDENYETVGRLFAGEGKLAVQPEMAPGTFVLFKGRRSCHQVRPVGKTTRPRLIALFSYDERPDMVFPEQTARNFTNPAAAPFYGKPVP